MIAIGTGLAAIAIVAIVISMIYELVIYTRAVKIQKIVDYFQGEQVIVKTLASHPNCKNVTYGATLGQLRFECVYVYNQRTFRHAVCEVNDLPVSLSEFYKIISSIQGRPI